MLEIVTFGSEILTKKALPVADIDHEIKALAEGMFDAMEKGRGVGLAGPQVGKVEFLLDNRPVLSKNRPPFEIELDLGRCELRRAGRPVETTPLELKLLALFVRSRGRTLTRDQLLDQVWGPGVFVTDRVVDNHINHLRRKIEPEPARPRYLVSVRGMGYRFDG